MIYALTGDCQYRCNSGADTGLTLINVTIIHYIDSYGLSWVGVEPAVDKEIDGSGAGKPRLAGRYDRLTTKKDS